MYIVDHLEHQHSTQHAPFTLMEISSGRVGLLPSLAFGKFRL